ncbi:MAG: biotin--[acetyl-CoA-carboxylase] ligase [Desulfobacterota bacterium]|nr:biotin--[acetyl-CoA-carboxylase] ligase [Thermodesulfobacteriota bacterium]MDW8001554.1 biotin--[acetyl-CoA-carboxylase] ligase [Deltaproteobacteria bacterium]
MKRVNYAEKLHMVGEGKEALNPERIKAYLTTTKIGRKIVYRRVIESTNTYALNLAKRGEEEGTCVVSDMQTKGRGRLERKWFSPPNENIYMSIILRPKVLQDQIYNLAFLSCLAVYDVVKPILESEPALKWPNDVLIKGKKVSGTLIEIAHGSETLDFAVVGIGLNVNMEEEDLPQDLKGVATSLYIETKKKHSRDLICANLINNFEKYYLKFLEEGPDVIRILWEEKAKIRGRVLTLQEGEKVILGICEGLNEKGGLVIKTERGTEVVYTGDLKAMSWS